MAIKVDRKLNSINAIDALTDLFILRGAPAFIRSDNGPEFIAQAIRDWIAAVGLRRLTSSQEAPGKRILRELQWQVQRRTAQRRDLLQPMGSANHHRRMEETLQYEETTQCIGPLNTDT